MFDDSNTANTGFTHCCERIQLDFAAIDKDSKKCGQTLCISGKGRTKGRVSGCDAAYRGSTRSKDCPIIRWGSSSDPNGKAGAEDKEEKDSL